jgi:xylan 1,4-beta-xylosidase
VTEPGGTRRDEAPSGASFDAREARHTASPRIPWFDEPSALNLRDRAVPVVGLPPPEDVRAVEGRGQVTVSWTPVEDAIGYLVLRSDDPDAELRPIDHGVGDVLAVPAGPYLDTTGIHATTRYAVASISTLESTAGPPSAAVVVEQGPWTEGRDRHPTVTISVEARHDVGPVHRPWQASVGSEHLALLLEGEGPGGFVVGDDLAEAFRIVRDELGVRMVRAHALLHDRLGVYREQEGRPVHDFSRVEAALDRLLETGLAPIVELSFMPHELASDPGRTTFDYRGIISPPRDMDLWRDLVEALVRHLVARYGRDTVAGWPFEVWNEPNLQLFWTGSQSDYFDLYDASAAAVKAVDPGFLIGGPATSGGGWVEDLLEHCRTHDVPLDFIATHTYGVAPVDLRPTLRRFDREDAALLWTEWGVSNGLGPPINDDVWSAPLVARGMRSAAGRLDSLSYWVASDQFVERGVPDRLFNGGFGLLTIGNLRKPRYWAIWMLQQLGDRELACRFEGDGAGSLVEAWPTRTGDRLAIAVWNGTRDVSKGYGDSQLSRAISLRCSGLLPGTYHLRHRRVDADHSNIHGVWQRFGDDAWPDDFGWERLREANHLEDLEPSRSLEVGEDGALLLEFELPMPGVSLLELEPTALPMH